MNHNNAGKDNCTAPLRFPKRLNNRPGLAHIDYRIGSYSDIRAALLRHIDSDEVLKDWTHREADDPGIALLEGAAILGDILTFYQNLYANEAFLRTAQWKESIGDLVRLLGYRLSPGLGGKATFTFGVKGTEPVVIPAGFELKAPVEGATKPAEFQTIEEAIAHPHLSQFSLYRPRRSRSAIKAGGNRLEIAAVADARDVASIQALDLQKGDRLITISNSAEILVVSKVEQVLDRTIVEFKGNLSFNRGVNVQAYRLGRSFRHFGHNAPAQFTKLKTVSDTTVATQENTRFNRKRCITDNNQPKYYSILQPKQIPLDQPVDDLAAGNSLIVQAPSNTGLSAIAQEIKRIVGDSLKWGNLSGATTMITLSSDVVCEFAEAFGLEANQEIDLRKVQYHETTSSAITLQAPTTWEDGPVDDAPLHYWGTYDEAIALKDRRLILHREDGKTLVVQVIASDFSLSGKDTVNPWLWPITLDQTAPFRKEDFDELAPMVSAYGNLVEANQGKREKEATLGNGDSRQIFQTFKLPKAPLTYFIDKSETPPEIPELEIYINDRLWTRVPSLFDQESKAEIYIVREDLNGESWVQFGDGKTGARLPSGIKNIKAKYRTGIGAYGPLKPETKVQAIDKLTPLDKIWLPGIATGGAEPESGDNAKVAAPGKIQSLGRLVSLQDFETETRAIAGVSKASASWQLVDNVPAVVITVLMENGREKEIADVQSILNSYNRCRGPQRFPIFVKQGTVRYCSLRVIASLDPTFREEALIQSIYSALGVANHEISEEEKEDNIAPGSGTGLLSASQRQFGQPEYATRVVATVQNVEGVIWSQVEAFCPQYFSGRFFGRSNRRRFPANALKSAVSCGPSQILALRAQDFEFQSVSAPQEDC
ncbi:MAG: hypothetical protein ACFB0D_15470 [Phormidesmis sp.]